MLAALFAAAVAAVAVVYGLDRARRRRASWAATFLPPRGLVPDLPSGRVDELIATFTHPTGRGRLARDLLRSGRSLLIKLTAEVAADPMVLADPRWAQLWHELGRFHTRGTVVTAAIRDALARDLLSRLASPTRTAGGTLDVLLVVSRLRPDVLVSLGPCRTTPIDGVLRCTLDRPFAALLAAALPPAVAVAPDDGTATDAVVELATTLWRDAERYTAHTRFDRALADAGRLLDGRDLGRAPLAGPVTPVDRLDR